MPPALVADAAELVALPATLAAPPAPVVALDSVPSPLELVWVSVDEPPPAASVASPGSSRSSAPVSQAQTIDTSVIENRMRRAVDMNEKRLSPLA